MTLRRVCKHRWTCPGAYRSVSKHYPLRYDEVTTLLVCLKCQTTKELGSLILKEHTSYQTKEDIENAANSFFKDKEDFLLHQKTSKKIEKALVDMGYTPSEISLLLHNVLTQEFKEFESNLKPEHRQDSRIILEGYKRVVV